LHNIFQKMSKIQHQYSAIYDRLNEQPHLQEIIREHYYEVTIVPISKQNHRNMVFEFEELSSLILDDYTIRYINHGMRANYFDNYIPLNTNLNSQEDVSQIIRDIPMYINELGIVLRS